MPKENTVFCTHCERYLPRKREREHRRLLVTPAVPPVVPSRLRRVVTVESDSDDDELRSPEMIDDGTINDGATGGVDDEMDSVNIESDAELFADILDHGAKVGSGARKVVP